MTLVRLNLFLILTLCLGNTLWSQPQQNEPIYSLVEEAPHFYSSECEQKNNALDKVHCSKSAYKKYIASNLRYPKEARAKGIRGIVLLEVVVETDGTVVVSRVLRDIGGGCADEASRLIKAMPKWVPGRKGGKVVRVKTPLTVKFS